MKRCFLLLVCLLVTAGCLMACGAGTQSQPISDPETSGTASDTSSQTEGSSEATGTYGDSPILPTQESLPLETLPQISTPGNSEPEYTVPIQPPTTTPPTESA